MARVLWIDGSAGASGDMILGMLVDLGLPVAALRRALNSLPLEGWTLRSRRVERCAIAARKIDVRVRAKEHGRGWTAIRRIVNRSGLDRQVKKNALAVFRRLIEAEARAHGRDPESVHLHEAGGTDAIVDVCGACFGLHELAIDRIVVSTLTTGFGAVRCSHGDYPVPGPATLYLVEGVPVAGGSIEAERLTPTGAAILTTLADDWGPIPPMLPERSGYGAGDHEFDTTPNLLRGLLGRALERDGGAAEAEIVVLECALDDATGQLLGYTIERLLAAGALDVQVGPLTMKKGRPGHALTVLARPHDAERLAQLVLEETPTFGIRLRNERRIEMDRSWRKVKTRYGMVRVKQGRLGGKTLTAWPEYEDCAQAATRHGVALATVQQAALSVWHRGSTATTKQKSRDR